MTRNDPAGEGGAVTPTGENRRADTNGTGAVLRRLVTVDREAAEVAHRLAVLAVEHGLAEMHPALDRLSHAIEGGRPAESVHDDLFDRFWAKYPRKVGKPTARRAWTRLMRKGVDIDAIRDGLIRWMRYWRDAGTKPQFIPHPHTWLSDERFNNEPPPLPRVLPPSGLAPGERFLDDDEAVTS